jgi:hypothetical protein
MFVESYRSYKKHYFTEGHHYVATYCIIYWSTNHWNFFREKLGGGKTLSDHEHSKYNSRRLDFDKHKKDR